MTNTGTSVSCDVVELSHFRVIMYGVIKSEELRDLIHRKTHFGPDFK